MYPENGHNCIPIIRSLPLRGDGQAKETDAKTGLHYISMPPLHLSMNVKASVYKA